MKKLVIFLLAAALLAGGASAAGVLTDGDITISAPSAVLMEQSTGTVIYEKSAHERLAPASVTKVMTLLLVMEALESGSITADTLVTASSEAASMGGSQIWLEEGEQMTVHEMLKCVAVSSANDCAVALAEHIAGSEEAFVSRMNDRAAALGMEDSHFTNCTGLYDDPAHLTSAWDVALMSRELLSHEKIKEYTTIWMDTVRGGEFGLSNTNKLIYYYDGATGLKTGFTRIAGHCLSASAEREGVEFIAVVMNAPSSADRFESAKALLNYAFANYATAPLRYSGALPPVRVELGARQSVQPVYGGPENVLIGKSQAVELSYELNMPESVRAPVAEGDRLGTLCVRAGEELIAEIPINAGEAVARLTTLQLFARLMGVLAGK